MIFSNNGIKSALAAIRSTPHDLHAPQEAEAIFKEKAEIDKQIPDINLGNARQVYLRAADFEEYGMTRGCPKCDYYLKSGNRRTNHTQQHVVSG